MPHNTVILKMTVSVLQKIKKRSQLLISLHSNNWEKEWWASQY